MDQVREVCSAASSLRKAKKLRVRLPLPKLTVAVEDPDSLRPFTDLIADELNVKAVELTDDIAAHGRFELTVNARAAGPRLGKAVQDAIKAVKAGGGTLNPDGTLTAGEVLLMPGSTTPNWSPPTRGVPPHCPTAPDWWYSTTPSPRNWRPRAGPRIESANCRICASPRAWRSAIGSPW